MRLVRGPSPTVTDAPVMEAASSDARNSTVFVTSVVFLILPIGDASDQFFVAVVVSFVWDRWVAE